MTILPETIEDKNFVIGKISNDQITEIQKVLDSCSYINEWDPPNDSLMSNAINRIEKSNESKMGNKEVYDLKVIIKRNTEEIVGIIECCYGYPTQEYFCISDIEIKKEYQHQGIGQEVVRRVISDIYETNEYTHLYVCVGLLNWPSLRFWSKLGFNKITNIFGDKEYSNNCFSSVILEM
jgi:diamine N-acetyltransferase